MLKSKLKSMAKTLRTAAAATVLLGLSAVALSFGFVLSFSLLAISIIWSVFGRRRSGTPDDSHSVIDLSKADYSNISH